MTPFSTLLVGSAASLLMSADLPGLSNPSTSAQSRVIHVDCDAGGDAFCQSLRQAISDRFPGRTVALAAPHDSIAPDLRFVPERHTDSSLSGHLEWHFTQQLDATHLTSGQGPTLELSVMDTTLNDRMLAAFAVQLVRHSDLPL